MSPLEMVRMAVEALGDEATAEQVVRYVGNRFGASIAVKFIPVYRATLRAEEELRRTRERAAAVRAEDQEARGAGKRQSGRTTR
jgi:hypothetical protein